MRSVYIAVFTVSTALIAFEVSLLQVLSIVQWHHFASLIISVALLGFGASGTILTLARRWMTVRFDKLLPLLAAGCAATIALAVPVSQTRIARFDSYLVFVEWGHVAGLLLTCLIFAVPFLLGALAIGLSFVRFTEDVGRLYLWNLVGSGFGGILAVSLMWLTEPSIIGPVSGIVAAAGAFPAAVRTGSRTVIAAALAAPLVCAGFAIYPSGLYVSQFKDISRTLDMPDARVIYRRPSPQGVVQVVSAPAVRYAPGLSLSYAGDVPVQDLVFVNGNAEGPIPHTKGLDSTGLYDFTTRALPYEMWPVDSVLVLSAGTGAPVRHARSRKAEFIRAVEPNAALTSLWRPVGDDVAIENVEPRTWLESDTARYDLIVLPDMGRFGGTVGLEELAENYLLTREALRAAWARLGPNGRIAISVWMDYPYRTPLRALASLVDALVREVVDPRDHIAAIRSWSDVTFTIVRPSIGSAAADSVRAFCGRRDFDPLLLPEIRPEERMRSNQLSDDSFLRYVDALVSENRRDFESDYPFLVGPTTDDRPFPMRFLRWRALPDVVRTFGDRTAPFFGLGLFIALLTLAQAVVLSAALIVAPLYGMRGARRGSIRTLFYFAALGVGYFLVEIVFIQRFTLFLGHPVYAAAAVISSMLVGSGIGSYVSGRLRARPKTIFLAAGAVSVAVIVYIPLLNGLFGGAIALPVGWRAFISLLMIFPPAFLMGFPFPLGLRLVGSVREAQVPWAWGVNGCFSVVAAAGAGLLAVQFGFTAVMAGAAAAYVAAALSLGQLRAERLSALRMGDY